MHPLLVLLATKPQLLADHAQAYVALFHEEFSLAQAAWRKTVVLQAVALCFLGMAGALAGVALMLWAVTPAAQIHTPGLLWLAPLLPLAVAVVCVGLARRPPPAAAFVNLSQQINADMALLRTVATP